jgi:thiosulfate/3-mercaptopyruvate sulfurtransferase
MDWREAIDYARNLRLKPEEELKGLLWERGITPDKEVITYCQVHQRSAHTYVTLKAIGYPRVKGYAGSWSEWGNDPRLPVEV